MTKPKVVSGLPMDRVDNGDTTTYSEIQKTMGKRIKSVNPLDREIAAQAAKVGRLGYVTMRCIDPLGGFDGMRRINGPSETGDGEVFDMPVTLLETKERYEKNVAKYEGRLDEGQPPREFFEMDGAVYVMPRWCALAEVGEVEGLQGFHGVHGNAGNVVA